MGQYGKQTIDELDIQAVLQTLTSSNLTQGEQVPLFESAICQYTKANYAVATSSATAALHISCLALGLSKSDIGWTVPLTFAASANAIRYCGADVDFVDIEMSTGCISVTKLAEKLKRANESNTLPKLLIVVHYAGISCDMNSIFELCRQYNVKIIEDASHAIGAKYKNKPVGNCQYSDICVFSFHPVKIITTGEGGMITTNSQSLAQQARLLACHGISKPSTNTQPSWFYEQHELGYNYRMSDIHAALGNSQLNKLDEFVSVRNQMATLYQKAFAELPIETLTVPHDCYSAWHIFVVRLTDSAKLNREDLYKTLVDSNIGCQVHYIPVHTHPYYQNLGFKWGDCPNAEKFYQHCLTIPLYPSMDNQQKIIEKLTSIL